jgi:magnesium-transporting ATPase (P-type)
VGHSVHDIPYFSCMYGKNSTQIPLTPIFSIFVDEALSAFNLYQIFAAVIWYFRDYFPYAVTILVFAVASLILTIYIIRRDQIKINEMAVKYKVRVHRRQGDGYIMKHFVDSEDLIPGDIFEIR